MNMRKAISITLSEDNLLWLRGQAAQTMKGSVSELLDKIVSQTRSAGWSEPMAVKSVINTIDLPEDDPNLEQADAYIRSAFAASARQPMRVRERPAGKKAAAKARRG